MTCHGLILEAYKNISLLLYRITPQRVKTARVMEDPDKPCRHQRRIKLSEATEKNSNECKTRFKTIFRISVAN